MKKILVHSLVFLLVIAGFTFAPAFSQNVDGVSAASLPWVEAEPAPAPAPAPAPTPAPAPAKAPVVAGGTGVYVVVSGNTVKSMTLICTMNRRLAVNLPISARRWMQMGAPY